MPNSPESADSSPSHGFTPAVENGRPLDIPDKVQALEELFERTEPGSRQKFRKFMEQAE